MKKNNIKGFTLIELLVVTGLVSLASIGIYGVSVIANDWRKVAQETKDLNLLVTELDNATISIGSLSNINKDNLRQFSSNFTSQMNLFDLVSPDKQTLHFIYKDMSSRLCNDFVSQILTSSTKVTSIVNNRNIQNHNLTDINNACSSNNNEVIIVYNQPEAQYSINSITASLNIPEVNHNNDPMITPSFPVPKEIPVVNVNGNSFSNSGVNTTIPLKNGPAPTYNNNNSSTNSPIIVSSGNSNEPVISTPVWTPPVYTPAPPATSAGIDDIDQNPLPPSPPPPPPPPPGVTSALPPPPVAEVPAGTAPAGQVGGVGELKINIAWGGGEDVDFALWDPDGYGYGWFAVGGSTGCRYKGCWDMDNTGQINAPGDYYKRQENVYYPSNPTQGRYVITMYRYRGDEVGNARISVTAVIGGVGVNQTLYMPADFNYYYTQTPYPVKVIIDLNQSYFNLYFL